MKPSCPFAFFRSSPSALPMNPSRVFCSDSIILIDVSFGFQYNLGAGGRLRVALFFGTTRLEGEGIVLWTGLMEGKWPSKEEKGGIMIPVKDLKEANLFKKLNTRELQQLGKHFTEESFEAGDVIFTQAEVAKNLYILLEGEVTLGIRAKGEIDITAYSVGKKGETFGLPSLNKPYRNSVSAICNKKTKVLAIQGETLRKLMWQNSKVGIEIMEKVAEVYLSRLNSTRAMIINLFKMFKFQTGKSKLIETYYES